MPKFTFGKSVEWNSKVTLLVFSNHRRSDGGGYRYLYPQKSAQVNFLSGKNDVRTAIQQFYTPQKTYTPQNKFLATPLLVIINC